MYILGLKVTRCPLWLFVPIQLSPYPHTCIYIHIYNPSFVKYIFIIVFSKVCTVHCKSVLLYIKYFHTRLQIPLVQ